MKRGVFTLEIIVFRERGTTYCSPYSLILLLLLGKGGFGRFFEPKRSPANDHRDSQNTQTPLSHLRPLSRVGCFGHSRQLRVWLLHALVQEPCHIQHAKSRQRQAQQGDRSHKKQNKRTRAPAISLVFFGAVYNKPNQTSSINRGAKRGSGSELYWSALFM